MPCDAMRWTFLLSQLRASVDRIVRHRPPNRVKPRQSNDTRFPYDMILETHASSPCHDGPYSSSSTPTKTASGAACKNSAQARARRSPKNKKNKKILTASASGRARLARTTVSSSEESLSPPPLLLRRTPPPLLPAPFSAAAAAAAAFLPPLFSAFRSALALFSALLSSFACKNQVQEAEKIRYSEVQKKKGKSLQRDQTNQKRKQYT